MSEEVRELVSELDVSMNMILKQSNLDAETVRVCHAVNRLLMLTRGE